MFKTMIRMKKKRLAFSGNLVIDVRDHRPSCPLSQQNSSTFCSNSASPVQTLAAGVSVKHFI